MDRTGCRHSAIVPVDQNEAKQVEDESEDEDEGKTEDEDEDEDVDEDEGSHESKDEEDDEDIDSNHAASGLDWIIETLMLSMLDDAQKRSRSDLNECLKRILNFKLEVNPTSTQCFNGHASSNCSASGILH